MTMLFAYGPWVNPCVLGVGCGAVVYVRYDVEVPDGFEVEGLPDECDD